MSLNFSYIPRVQENFKLFGGHGTGQRRQEALVGLAHEACGQRPEADQSVLDARETGDCTGKQRSRQPLKAA